MVAFQVARSRLVHIQIYFKQTGVSFIRACFVIYLASPFHFVHHSDYFLDVFHTDVALFICLNQKSTQWQIPRGRIESTLLASSV
jgi:hypothetical protein